MPISVPRLFLGMTATSLAPVSTFPTTAAHLVLFNGESLGGKSYTITSVGFTTTTSNAAAQVSQLLCNVIGGSPPFPVGTVASGPLSADGIIGGSKGTVVTNVALGAGIAASGLWHTVGPSINAAASTATISLGSWSAVNGIYVLAPGNMLALTVLCSTVTSAKCNISITWSEA